MADTITNDHFADPAGQDAGVSLLTTLAGKGVISPVDDAVGHRVGLDERGAVIHDGGVRHVLVVLGFHYQHVSPEFGTGCKGTVVCRAQPAATVGHQAWPVELLL